MEYDGTIKDGVVVFSGNVRLPDGTRVRVQPLAEAAGDEDAAGAQQSSAKPLANG